VAVPDTPSRGRSRERAGRRTGSTLSPVGSVRPGDPRLEFRTVHGYRRAFVVAGPTEPGTPALLLIHGIGDSSDTWRDLVPVLARDHTVIAPDLLGHGRSEKPRADYSIAAFANGIRDLLSVLGVERVTVVGHSLGGGVAMQFAYQFPDLCERLVLVSTGGVGREVNPVLRLVSLPNADVGLHLLRVPTARWAGHLGASLLRRTGLAIGHDAHDLVRVFDALPDATSRSAVVRTLRAVVDWRGQVVTMLDRAYLARGMPTMLVWGSRDPIIPTAHAHAAHAALPGSRLEVFEGAGHFPHHSDPARFVSVLAEFLATTPAADHDPEHWRGLLRTGRPGEFSDAHAALTEETISAATRSGT
jgi:pimeloyl-ACP methyl ester carboxylesterase